MDFCAGTSFQSTRPHGARHEYIVAERARREVSIHAPARGATRTAIGVHGVRGRFNPRARTGRDTPTSAALSMMACFNPRARTGRDMVCRMQVSSLTRFQSTRPHGARPGTAPPSRPCPCFNPRARTGRDRPKSQPRRQRRSFNPRARTGRDGSFLP